MDFVVLHLGHPQVTPSDKLFLDQEFIWTWQLRPNQLIFMFLIIKKIKFNEGMLYKNKNNQIMWLNMTVSISLALFNSCKMYVNISIS